MTSISRALAVLTLASIALVPAAVQAQSPQPPNAASVETARALYNEGKELRARGDVAGALAKFRAAHELGRTPITGIELARTLAAQGQLLEAREVCLGISRIPVATAETDRSTAARQEAAQFSEELRTRIPSLVVRVQNVPQGSSPVVTIDRAAVPVAALSEPFKVNPGRHEVSAKLPRGPESFVMIEVPEGQSRDVSLAVAPEPPLPAGSAPAPYVTQTAPQPQQNQPPPPPVSTKDQMRSPELAVVGGVTAGLGVILGSIFGGLAIERTNYVRDHCPNHRCPPFAHDALDKANNYGLVSTVSFIISGVGLVIASLGASPVHDRFGAARGPRQAVKPSFFAGPTGIHGSF